VKWRDVWGPRTRVATYLDFNVQNTTLAWFNDRGNSLFAGTVKVTGKFGMLYEATAIEKGDEFLARDEMVLYAIDLSWSRSTSGIWIEIWGERGTRMERCTNGRC
jgi:hypothetical protein